MTRRPRAHQLEDESRRAFVSQLPTAWTVQDLVPDYGLDQRVEIFDEGGRATGLGFYVQLKGTDGADNSQNRQIRVRPDHYNYWNSLNDPVLLVLYFSTSKTIYVRWAHRFHPDFYPEEKRIGRQTIRFFKSAHWRSGDNEWVIEELMNLRQVAQGAVHLPISVGVSESPETPLRASSLRAVLNELKNATSRAEVRWRVGDDRSDTFHVYISDKRVMARAGKVIYSISNTSESKDPHDLPKVKAALCCLGFAVAMAGSDSPGMELISRYCASPPLLLGPWVAQHVLLVAMRSRQFGLAMDLIESWLEVETEKASEAAAILYGSLKMLGSTRLSATERKRLAQIGTHESLLFLKSTMAAEMELQCAIEFGQKGLLSESVRLFEAIFSEAKEDLDIPTDVVLRAAEWALELGEYESAETWLRNLSVPDHSIDVILLLTKCLIKQGRYAEALVNLHLSTDENDRRGRIVLTGFVLVLMTLLAKTGVQERQPDAALNIGRSLRDDAKIEDIWETFLAAAQHDAASLSTWSLCQMVGARSLVDEESSGFLESISKAQSPEWFVCGAHGSLGTAVLDDRDGEWWAIACCTLLNTGYLRCLTYCVDFAIEVCRDSFLEALSRGYPDTRSTKMVSVFADMADRARRVGAQLYLRESPEHLNIVKAMNPKFARAYVLTWASSGDEDTGESEQRLVGVNREIEPDAMYHSFRRAARYIIDKLEVSTEDAPAK